MIRSHSMKASHVKPTAARMSARGNWRTVNKSVSSKVRVFNVKTELNRPVK